MARPLWDPDLLPTNVEWVRGLPARDASVVRKSPPAPRSDTPELSLDRTIAVCRPPMWTTRRRLWIFWRALNVATSSTCRALDTPPPAAAVRIAAAICALPYVIWRASHLTLAGLILIAIKRPGTAQLRRSPRSSLDRSK